MWLLNLCSGQNSRPAKTESICRQKCRTFCAQKLKSCLAKQYPAIPINQICDLVL